VRVVFLTIFYRQLFVISGKNLPVNKLKRIYTAVTVTKYAWKVIYLMAY